MENKNSVCLLDLLKERQFLYFTMLVTATGPIRGDVPAASAALTYHPRVA